MTGLPKASVWQKRDLGTTICVLYTVWKVSRGAVQPLHNVEALGAIEQNRVSVKQVWHDHEVAVCSKLVGNARGRSVFHEFPTENLDLQLSIDELMPNYIWQNKDGIFGGLALGV